MQNKHTCPDCLAEMQYDAEEGIWRCQCPEPYDEELGSQKSDPFSQYENYRPLNFDQ